MCAPQCLECHVSPEPPAPVRDGGSGIVWSRQRLPQGGEGHGGGGGSPRPLSKAAVGPLPFSTTQPVCLQLPDPGSAHGTDGSLALDPSIMAVRGGPAHTDPISPSLLVFQLEAETKRKKVVHIAQEIMSSEKV